MADSDQPERLLSVARDVYFVSVAPQEKFDRRDDVRLVVGDQDFLAHVVTPVEGERKVRATSLYPHPATKCSTIWWLMCDAGPLPLSRTPTRRPPSPS